MVRRRRPRRGRARRCGRRSRAASGTSCSITSSVAPVSLADAQQQRAERLGLALRDARRRLVEQQHRRSVREHAREVDDAPAAGRELADELVAEVGDAEQLEQLARRARRRRPRRRRPTGRCSAAATGSRTSRWRSNATAIVSATRERPGTAARPGTNGRARAGRAAAATSRVMSRRVVAVAERRSCPSSAGEEAGDRRRTAWSCPRRSGPMKPTISPAAAANDTSVQRARARRSACDTPSSTSRTRSRGVAVAVACRCAVRAVRRRGARATVAAGRGRFGRSRARVAAPSRNTERSTSGRSSSSAVGPWKRISPFSMKYAVSAIVSARFTDCSTRMIVVPLRGDVAHDRQQLLDDRRREPERQLVDHQQARLLDERHARASSICCWPPERLPAGSSSRSRRIGNSSSTCSVASRRRAPCPCGAASPRAAGARRPSASGTRPGRRAPDDDAASRDLVRVARTSCRGRRTRPRRSSPRRGPRSPSAASTCRRRSCRAARRSRPRRPRS